MRAPVERGVRVAVVREEDEDDELGDRPFVGDKGGGVPQHKRVVEAFEAELIYF